MVTYHSEVRPLQVLILVVDDQNSMHYDCNQQIADLNCVILVEANLDLQQDLIPIYLALCASFVQMDQIRQWLTVKSDHKKICDSIWCLQLAGDFYVRRACMGQLMYTIDTCTNALYSFMLSGVLPVILVIAHVVPIISS
jgi:hypothetical protein